VLLALALPALVFVLWPLRRLGERRAAGAPDGRRRDLLDDRAAVLRALGEIDQEHAAGLLSDADHAALRASYEARAGRVLAALDALPAPAEPGAAPPAPAPGPARSRARHPAAVAAGAATLVLFGLLLGLSVGRYTEPDPMVVAPGSRLPVPRSEAEPGTGGPAASGEAARPIPPETLAGMLRAARQALAEGQYAQAIAAYQAVLKRDPRNVDALTHLGLIVAIGGHRDEALATLERAIGIDAGYAPAHLYRGQLLLEGGDAAGAIRAWERFVALAPPGPERERGRSLIEEARRRRPAAPAGSPAPGN
jgi:tetratricopeptide (TPR) repeat protein